MEKQAPIGIFDSGIGGLSIWREIIKLMPFENTVYLADNKNAPYGRKTKSEIVSLSIKNTEFLLEQGAKVIVVACNTATTNAIRELRKSFPNIQFIGTEPAIKPAALGSETKSIAVLATYNTINSEAYHLAQKKAYMRNIDLLSIAGNGLVELIEAGKLNSPEIDLLLKEYLLQIINSKNIDYLVLGCTHYPFLRDKIKTVLPLSVNIIDSGVPVAKQTKAVIKSLGLLNDEDLSPQHRLLYNGSQDVISHIIMPSDYVNIQYFDF